MLMLAVLVGAAGHGSFLPMALLSSPMWLGWFVWPCIFALAALGSSQTARVLAAGLIGLNYLGVPWTFPPDVQFMSELRRVDRFAGVVIALYLATQVLLWWRILRAKKAETNMP